MMPTKSRDVLKGAEDITEQELGNYDPLANAEDLGVAEKGSYEEVDPGFLAKVANVIDIPGSLARTGIEAAISPEKEVLPSMMSQIQKTIENPTMAAQEAPRGVDINKEIFPEYKSESIPGKIGGFLTETITDPINWFSGVIKATKPARTALMSASERQAAKAIAPYASKTATLREGKDLEVIGSRLVSEDLQGLIRNPKKLYEHIAGKTHVSKLNPESLDTLQIKRSMPEGGKIAEVSNGLKNAISEVEKQYDIKSIMPENVMMDELAKKTKVAMSKTSGETPNLSSIENILNKTLKPYDVTEIPPHPISGVVKEPSTLDLLEGTVGMGAGTKIKEPSNISLTQLHELRKNIGKQISDRSFYADPSQEMRQETEVLRDVYRNLGDVIEKNLTGKKIKIGNTLVDAGQYYKAQNNRLKSLMDVRSMLEYVPTQELKSPDVMATLSKMGIRGGTYGAAAAGASMAGMPIHPLSAGVMGGIIGAGQELGKAAETSTPEYLTSIFKTAAKVVDNPATVPFATRGTIQFMKEGKPVSESELDQGRYPNSVGISPMDMINWRIPRTTQGILENKDKVLAKIVQAGIPDQMTDHIAYALNGNPEDLANIAPLVMTQFPELFERSKYKTFDGMFMDPMDKAKAADSVSKDETKNSIERAKMISKINKHNQVPEGLA